MDASFGTGVVDELGVRYSRLTRYLSRLEEGLASYPECVARSAVAQGWLAAAPDAFSDTSPLVAALLERPRGPWSPEVVVHAMLLAIADRAAMTDAQFAAWSRAASREMYRGPLFRALMGFCSPQALLARAADRWSAMHRGTELSVAEDGPRRATLRLRFPPRLFAPLHLAGYAEAFAAAIEHSRAHLAIVEVAAPTETAATFVARWS